MKYFAKFFTVLMVLTVLSGLSSCGKIAHPQPIEGSGYPHSYPRH